MSYVETLRTAAQLMRERANAATPGPWQRYGMTGVAATDGDVVGEQPIVCEDCGWRVAVTGCATAADAEHIASWHPAVALAIADWLDAAAEREQEHHDRCRDRGDDPGEPQPGDEVYGALVVARAYLGGAR